MFVECVVVVVAVNSCANCTTLVYTVIVMVSLDIHISTVLNGVVKSCENNGN